MEYLLLILTVLGVIIGILGILYLYSSQYDYDEYKYKCHHCKRKFRKDELKDLRGPWHTKDWTCPHCKHQNITLKSYDY